MGKTLTSPAAPLRAFRPGGRTPRPGQASSTAALASEPAGIDESGTAHPFTLSLSKRRAPPPSVHAEPVKAPHTSHPFTLSLSKRRAPPPSAHAEPVKAPHPPHPFTLSLSKRCARLRQAQPERVLGFPPLSAPPGGQTPPVRRGGPCTVAWQSPFHGCAGIAACRYRRACAARSRMSGGSQIPDTVRAEFCCGAVHPPSVHAEPVEAPRTPSIRSR